MTYRDTYFSRLGPIALASLLITGNVWAQTEPVRNWAAPLYWQPSARESTIMRRAAEERLGTQGMTPDATGGSATTPLVFVAVTPCRMMDTRGYDSTFTSGTAWGPPALTAGSTRTVPVAGVTAGYCSLPATAQAVSVNVTLWPTPGTQVQWITLWPAGVAKPAASTINDYQGTMFNSANGVTIYGINNAAIVPLGTGGAFDIYVTDETNVFIDVNGYYTAIGDANGNTMLGIGTLANNTTGDANTATGNGALGMNTTGNANTANGNDALAANSTGGQNTANGSDALQSNTTGSFNTANGSGALQGNTTGNSSTATGADALLRNTTGSGNTATGATALFTNTTGSSDMADGSAALYSNTTGNFNTAAGYSALEGNTTGSGNTASGSSALANNTTGNNNIAVGNQAALTVSAGNSNNIHIGTEGASADNGAIRIGGNTALGDPATQTQFFASGISGTATGLGGALAVVVDANGQLGTVSSSRRYKEDIEDMGDASSGLMELRPVTFRYRRPYSDGSKPLDYGLIAEEVEEVYPDLVAKNAAGQIESVQYRKLIPMLLNELQKENAELTELRERLARLESASERPRGKP